jgi:uncharacterized membrane protein YvbJ
MITCPNCGLANPDNAKFCGNCGTPFDNVPVSQPSSYKQQSQSQYQTTGAATPSGSNVAKKIGLGCLIAIVIFLFFGLSCTRACLRMGHRRVYIQRRY